MSGSTARNGRWPTFAVLVVAAWASTSFALGTAQDGVSGLPPTLSPKAKPAPPVPTLDDTARRLRVQSTLVTAPVTVLDTAGNFVYGLGQDDFQVLDNGVPQQIARFSEDATGDIAAVIVVQANESVAPLLDQVRPLGSIFSSLLLGERGRAAVIFFSDRVQVAQEFSSSADQLAATLRSVQPHGTDDRLNDALDRAVALLEKCPKDERRIIVAFSDGSDHGSETKPEEVVRHATGAGVTIYGLGFNPAEAVLLQKPQEERRSAIDNNLGLPTPPGMVRTPDTLAATHATGVPVVPIILATGEIVRSTAVPSLLDFYAGYTGGVYYSHWSKKALQDQLSRVASEVHSQYELAYIPDTLATTGFHRIEVRVQRPGMRVRTRAGYFYAGRTEGQSVRQP
jgi:VWFA-related protein